MSKHDQKGQIKDLLDLEAENGPVVTITIPLNPKLDDTRLDKIQTDSLIDSAKDAFQKIYKPDLWNAYEFHIKNYLKTLKPNASIAKGVVLYVTNDSLKAVKLNYAPEPAFSFSDKLQIFPIVKQLEFVPDFDMLFLQRDSYKLDNVKDLDVTQPDNDTQDPFDSDKTETETIKNPKTNDAEWDTHKYFEMVDKYVQKRYSDKDHNPLVLVANAEDEGRFKKASHNPYLVTDKSVEIDGAVKNAGENAQDIAQTIHDQFVADGKKAIKGEYDKADGAKKATDDFDTIMKAAEEDRIANLIIQDDAYVESKDNGETVEVNTEGSRPANELNTLALTVLGLDGDVTMLPASDMPTDKKVAAILRW
ncbi:baeRF3 domain-containing protein [Fructilactobacillus lindneri]|uniref:Uncharacterized protein n=1 Tax=Fructilactobacillus lindneri DSM 20690 = JCM 11027 TaxID=1122148 RepID=A0A0R2JX61_9LACO|nr:hypothetical protein [Fructilactobacillus lindneri]KRN78820.1 hypothetical protein IV52_GL001100 [Fructilactobacillus lindneri DSM 20690 = JCM 11027]POH06376.1 hypothetical protein BGL35_03185 [Fructilactobacillus lindneri]POH23916.1 hypothetical protein BHU33_03185 [Fructilactobacillus lindneri DSM 20690 = JCM 11027]SJZ85625.1 hypothetical protein SAMN02746042_00562 [Fructilactobacillus lindneri DSM 20690 = JCM 11027]